MLVAADSDAHCAGGAALSKLRVLKMVGRRSLPSLIEATVVPSVLFYVFLVAIGPVPAMCAALAWAYGSVLRRLVGRQPVPGVLQLAVAALTVRTVVGEERIAELSEMIGGQRVTEITRAQARELLDTAGGNPVAAQKQLGKSSTSRKRSKV